MPNKFDVIVVGARCAGGALATFLAKNQAKVALVDAAARHSDAVVSTHTLHPAGMDVLTELGLAPAIKEGVQPWLKWRFDLDDAPFDVPMPAGREEHGPRRYFLDGIVQDAAQTAGAEFMDNTRLEELISADGRVQGVRCSQNGRSIELQADLVVGADGRNSTVARLVGAEEYLAYDSPRGAYWAYWETPADWRTAAHPFQGYFGSRDRTLRFFFETNERQLLVGTAPLTEVVQSWRSSHVESYLADVRSDPTIAAVIDNAKQVSQVRGTVREHYFFRRAAGPGWALVGDAGHHKDFCIGDGITQALRDARNLATELHEGINDAALIRYWRRRDVDAYPFFRLAEQVAVPEPPRLNHFIFRRVGESPELIRRFWRQFEHDIDPLDAVPFSVALRSVLDGLLRGEIGVLKEFFVEGKRISTVRKEAARLKQLLTERDSWSLPFAY